MARVTCSATVMAIFSMFLATGVRGRMLQEAKDGILPAGFNNMLQSILPSAPYTLSKGSTDTCKKYLDMAQKPCTSSLSAQTANFKHGDRTYPVTLCVCKGGPYDIKGLADEVARVPDFLLYFVKGVTSVKGDGIAQTYSQVGQMQVFTKVNARVLTHESAHAQDYAAGVKDMTFTQGQTWLKAVAARSCAPTAYAAEAGPTETYGDAMLPYVFNLYRGSKYAAFDTSCLKAELKAIDTYTKGLSST